MALKRPKPETKPSTPMKKRKVSSAHKPTNVNKARRRDRSETVDDEDNSVDATQITSEEQLEQERDDGVTVKANTGSTTGSGDSESHASPSPKMAGDVVSDNEDWHVLRESEENTGDITSSDPDDLERINSWKEEGANLKAVATTLDTNPNTKAATSSQTAQVTDFTPDNTAPYIKTAFQTIPGKHVQKVQPIVDMESYAPVKRVELDGEKMNDLKKGGILDRIRQAGRYMDTTDVIPFDLLPVGIHWGNKPPFTADRSSLLCMPGTNDPCVVWFIGQVCGSWFYDRQNQPQPRVSISIVPWTFGTGTRARQLLRVLSDPPVETIENNYGVVRASKFMTVFSENERLVKDFNECYDATNMLKAKGDMMPADVKDINIRDTVLIEARIGRYKLKLDGSNKTPFGWTSYRSSLELVSVAIIHRASMSSIEPETSDLSL